MQPFYLRLTQSDINHITDRSPPGMQAVLIGQPLTNGRLKISSRGISTFAIRTYKAVIGTQSGNYSTDDADLHIQDKTIEAYKCKTIAIEVNVLWILLLYILPT